MGVEKRTILLIQPPIRDFYFTRKRSIPYGLLSIASVLEEQGFDIVLIDGLATSKSRNIELPDSLTYLEPYYRFHDRSPFSLFHKYKHFGYSFEHIGKLAKMSKAFLVGISSLFTAYSGEALAVAREVRKALPQCRIVMGGHHPTQLPQSVMKEPAVDFIIRGEGEYSMAGLADAILSGRYFDKIPGLVYRLDSGELHISEPAVVEDPDDFPLPAMQYADLSFYSRALGTSAVITASRGCPMPCSYCCVAKGASRYRRRSVESVFAEIKTAVTVHNARFIDFEDENLTLDRAWCMDLLGRIVSEFGGLGLELRAMNGLFPSTLDEELIDVMKTAGFKTLNLSLCTISTHQLKRFRRPDVRKSLERVLEYAGKKAMEAVTYIIVGAPGQDPFESVKDLIYLAGQPTLAGVSVYYPAPGSADWNTYAGLFKSFDDFSVLRSSAIPVSDTTTRLDSLTLLRLGRILNYAKDLNKKSIPFAPKPLQDNQMDINNRHDMGIRLLESFYHDGKIRGISPDGSVFLHDASHALCEMFRKETGPMFFHSNNAYV